MTKGRCSEWMTLEITGQQKRIYQGRTELGIGQHEKIKRKLEEERHKEYQDHMARKAREETSGNFRRGESGDGLNSSTGIGSVVDIGYETSQKFAQQRKMLYDARRAEYAALIASHSTTNQPDSEDGNGFPTETSPSASEEQVNATHFLTPGVSEMSSDERKQKQRSYADALREQIAEKKRTFERNKKKEREEDKKNMEWAQGSNKNFNYGSYNCNNVS